MGQLSLEKTFLLAAYIEALVYGFFLCIFCSTMYLHFFSDVARKHDRHTSVMMAISCVMFFLATWHLIMNCIRLLAGYVDHRLTPGGPAAYIGDLRPWDHILKDTIYATQENLGSAAAIYRCWVLWHRNWRIVVLPIALLIVNFVAGYVVCATYSSIEPTATVFNPRLDHWIKTFYSIAVILNILTTSLMSYRIYRTHRKSSAYVVGKGGLITICRILVESAALQLLVEIVLLSLFCANINAQYILLESVTSVVGITFNIITLRIKLHTMSRPANSSNSGGGPVQTIGSLPMRPVHIDITQDISEDHIQDIPLSGSRSPAPSWKRINIDAQSPPPYKSPTYENSC